jgi:hypothetical protein
LTPAQEAEAANQAEAILCSRYHASLFDSLRHEHFETVFYARAKDHVRKVALEVIGRFKSGTVTAGGESQPPDNLPKNAALVALNTLPWPRAEILKMRRNNETWARIAHRFGITTSDARSLYNSSIAVLVRLLHPRRNL